MKKFLVVSLILSILILLIYAVHPGEAEEITWGTTFSQKQAEKLGLDWQDTYISILDDLGVKHLRLVAYWDYIEPADEAFSFADLDWQMQQAQARGADVILVTGMKVPRWPECHIPGWAQDVSEEKLKDEILEMLGTMVLRYKDHGALSTWQVENEPLLDFGKCPFSDLSFLEEEINLVRSLDSDHDVITSDSGELSIWLKLAGKADKLAVTQYQKVWSAELDRYMSLPIPASFYVLKAWLVDKILEKEVFVGELQAEPWVDGELEEVSIEEMEKTLTLDQFRRNLAFAKRTGMNTFYLWGSEWWYYMKITHNQEDFWEEARSVFNQ